MDIFEEPSGKWKSEIVSRFHANQVGFVSPRLGIHPAAKKIMRLRINDMIAVPSKEEDGKAVIYRVQKLSGKRHKSFCA